MIVIHRMKQYITHVLSLSLKCNAVQMKSAGDNKSQRSQPGKASSGNTKVMLLKFKRPEVKRRERSAWVKRKERIKPKNKNNHTWSPWTQWSYNTSTLGISTETKSLLLWRDSIPVNNILDYSWQGAWYRWGGSWKIHSNKHMCTSYLTHISTWHTPDFLPSI